MFRGVSQTDQDPAIQGSINLEHESGFFVGAWASNVDFNDGDEASVEIDIYGGFSRSVGDLSYSLTALYYYYPGADDQLNYDYFESLLTVEYEMEYFTPKLTVAFSPEYFGDTGYAWYVSGGATSSLRDWLSVSGALGYQGGGGITTTFGEALLDWNLGFTVSYLGLDFDLRYYDTDLNNNPFADERFVFTLSKSF